MSEDTPDTHVDNAEPSMEDILASIRRIIADEDVGVNTDIDGEPTLAPEESFTILESANELSADVGQVNVDVDEEISVEAADSDIDLLLTEIDDSATLETLDLDSFVDEVTPESALDLTEPGLIPEPEKPSSTLGGLGAVAAAGLGAIATAGATTATHIAARRNKTVEPETSEALDLILDTEDAVGDTDADLHDLLKIPDTDAPNAEFSAGVEQEDDIDRLLNDLLMEEDTSVIEDERVIDPAADLLADDGPANDSEDEISDELLSDLLGDEEHEAVALPTSTQDSKDLDLVKSLMADLTDDPFEDAAAVGDSETQLVDEILSLSMDDEMELQSDEALDSMAGHVSGSDPFIIDMDDDLSSGVAERGTPSESSLADIAKAAENDAERIERRSGFAATGFAAGAGMMVASAGPVAGTVNVDANVAEIQEAEDILAAIATSNDDEPIEVSAQTDTANEVTPPQDIPTQEESDDMPKAAAKKKESIVDDVTEEVTAGAFASLNKVVEEKAIMADRGDRIGDLVQEALRPMLKEWLDKNLKTIVERAVTKEVKRISSGK